MNPQRCIASCHSHHALTLCLGLAALFLAGAFVPVGAEDITWDNPSGGGWNASANWDPQDVPDEAGEVAIVPAGAGEYTISLDTSPGIDALAINNAEATLTLGSNTLTLLEVEGLSNHGLVLANSGTGVIMGLIRNHADGRIEIVPGRHLQFSAPAVENDGLILVHNASSSNNAILTFLEDAGLSGSGELILHTNGVVSDAQLLTTPGTLLTQQAPHRIRGAGTIEAALVNHGEIFADQDATVLLLTANPKSNHGTIGATGTGLLELRAFTLTQAGAGTLLAQDGPIDLRQDMIVVGGALASTGSGRIECAYGTTRLEDVSIDGLFQIRSAVTLELAGDTIENNGEMVLHYDTSINNSYLQIVDDLTLTGDGTLRMMIASSSTADAVIASVGPAVLTHDSGHTIHGGGEISAYLENHGVIFADQEDALLALKTNPKTNHGTIGAREAGKLELQTFTLTQTGAGMLLAEDAGIELGPNSVVSGGLLSATGSGWFECTDGTTRLEDVTLDGLFQIRSTVTVELAGNTIENNGEMVLHYDTSTNNAYLEIVDDLALTGDGTLRMMIASNSTADALIASVGSAVLTHDSGHTIHGAGEISAYLENHGVIFADQEDALLVLKTNPKTNHGTIGAREAGKLELQTFTLTQTGAGMLLAQDAGIGLGPNSIVSGGLLSATGSGWFECTDGTARLEDVTLDGPVRIPSTVTLELAGDTIENNAEIVLHLDGSSNNAYLHAGSDVALTGTGSVRLLSPTNANDSQITSAPGVVLTLGPGQLVHGAGTVSAVLHNEGLIQANIPDATLRLGGEDKVTTGTLAAVQGGMLELWSATLTNAGTMMVADSSSVAVLTGGAMLNQGAVLADHHGLFRVDGATLRNQGEILSVNGGEVRSQSGTFVNQGSCEAGLEGLVRVEGGAFRNEGIARAREGGLFWCNVLSQHYSAANQELTGGDWQVMANTAMRLIGAADVTHLDAGILLSGENSNIYSDEATGNVIGGVQTIGRNGSLRIDAGRDFSTVSGLVSDGGVFVGEGSTLTMAGNLLQSWYTAYVQVNGDLVGADTVQAVLGTVGGSGTIHADVICGGRTNPGASVGELTITGDYDQIGDGALYIEFSGNGPGEHDHLQVLGTATLAGRVWVEVPEGVVIYPGDVFTVLTAGSRTGEFSELYGNFGVGLQYSVVYTDTTVELHVYEDVSAIEEDPAVPDPDVTDPVVVEPVVPRAARLSAASLPGGLTRFYLELPEAADVQLEIFDFNGRRIAQIEDQAIEAGRHVYRWDGHTAQGAPAGSGVYFGRARVATAEGQLHWLKTRLTVIR